MTAPHVSDPFLPPNNKHKLYVVAAAAAVVILAACGGAGSKDESAAQPTTTAALTTAAPTTQKPTYSSCADLLKAPATITTTSKCMTSSNFLVTGAYIHSCVDGSKVGELNNSGGWWKNSEGHPGEALPGQIYTDCVSPKPTTTTPPTTAPNSDADVLAKVVAMTTTQRDGFIKAVEADTNVTVEAFDADVHNLPDPSYLTMTVDTGYRTDENQRRGLWEMVRAIAPFWKTTLRNDAGQFHVGLVVTAHGHTYTSSYETMTALADKRLAEDDWFAAAG